MRVILILTIIFIEIAFCRWIEKDWPKNDFEKMIEPDYISCLRNNSFIKESGEEASYINGATISGANIGG
jgi:hypothetical protein